MPVYPKGGDFVLRKRITTALEVTGMALIVAGFTILAPIAGLIAGGIALVLIGALSA